MQNNINFARKNNLSMSQMGTLFGIHRNGPCGVSEISDTLGISCAAVSQMLERLVQQGLVRRTEAAHDRRAKVIDLTDEGRQKVNEVLHYGRQWMVNLADSLSPEEQQRSLEVMNILVEKAARLKVGNTEKRGSHLCGV